MVGLIGKKNGMTRLFDDKGNAVPVTIIKVDKNIVINRKVIDRDGYNAIVIGSVDLKENKVKKPYKGQFEESVLPKKYLKEFRVNDPGKYNLGQEVGLEIFKDTDYIDVVGISKGKGFQGVIKRHGFSGGPASHGSKFKRQNGSTGQSAYPSRGFKGVKRAGRMGHDKITLQNLKIFEINNDKNILILRGSIPGVNKGIVYLNKALKKG